jgi:hypothetical protein
VNQINKNIGKPTMLSIFFLCLMLFLNAFLVKSTFSQTSPAENEPSGDLHQAIEYIKEFDQKSDTTKLKKAIDILESFPEYTPVELYWKSEAWVKYYLFMLQSSPEDPRLSKHIRSHLLELWVSWTELEEQIHPDTLKNPQSGIRKTMIGITERCARSIVSSARFLDFSTSLAPLLKNLLDRVSKYDFFLGSEYYLSITNEFLAIDYPNMLFLSYIIEEIDSEKELADIDFHVEADREKRKELAALSLAAADAATTPFAKCVAYFLGAWNKEWEDPEGSYFLYNKALEQFEKFEEPGSEFLARYFNKSLIRDHFIAFINKYGKRLEEEDNYLRYASLLEAGWEIEDISPGDRFTLAKKLGDVVYPILIDQFRQKGKEDIAEEYLLKKQKMDVYIATHQ